MATAKQKAAARKKREEGRQGREAKEDDLEAAEEDSDCPRKRGSEGGQTKTWPLSDAPTADSVLSNADDASGGLTMKDAFVAAVRLGMTCLAAASLACRAAGHDDAPLGARTSKSAALAICDSVVSLFPKTAGVRITRAETTAAMLSTTSHVHACHVAMVADSGLSSAAWASTYWADSTRGWREIFHWAADGPDGGSRTLVRPGLRCQVDHEHDGGDDSDSTYVPSPRVAERTTCWADSAGITARDAAP